MLETNGVKQASSCGFSQLGLETTYKDRFPIANTLWTLQEGSKENSRILANIKFILWAPFGFIGYIFVKIGSWIKRNLFFWISSSENNGINWKQTARIFNKIYVAVHSSMDDSEKRLKAIAKAKGELSKPALEKWREYIGLASAEENGIKDSADQLKWYQKHRDEITINDFQSLNNKTFKNAVAAFNEEIRKKIKE